MVYCSARTLRALPGRGEPVNLAIETHVREDHIHLYGFADGKERDWFGLLQSVQGVGARVALGILSVLSPAALTQAVALQEASTLTQSSGVGPKLGKRIVSELKDHVLARAVVEGASGGGAASLGDTNEGDTSEGPADDAVSALVNLGYRRLEAQAAVAGVTRNFGSGTPVEELIRHGLQELGR
jgi:Holliday junction DNA helicase RuvA